MALGPPGPVVMILNILGLPWPGINEDQLRDWAASVRQFSGDICDSSSQVNQTIRELADTSQSAVITSAADFWEDRHQLLVNLRGPLDAFAEALDLAAYEVEAQKWAVIGAAGAMAAEFTATQAGAFFTFGADEAALPAELAMTREAVKEALEKLTTALIGGGLQYAIQEIIDHLNRTMGSILNTAFEVHMEVHSLKILYKTLRDTVQRIRGIIDAIKEISSNAHSKNANRDLADSSGGGGWSEIIHVIEGGAKEFADALLKNLPGILIQSLEAMALGLLKLADRAESADSDGAPGVSVSGEGSPAQPPGARNPQGGGLRTPETGDSDGGPGEWVARNRGGGSQHSWEFQESVTGVTRDREYRIDDVDMDGWNGSEQRILEAKDQYIKFIKNGEFQKWWNGKGAILGEAKTQIEIARKYNLKLRWVTPYPQFKQAVAKLLDDEKVDGRGIIEWEIRE